MPAKTFRLYAVQTEKFGVIHVRRDSIAEARAWAKGAFGLGPKAVTVHREPGELCDSCQSTPCCCRGEA